MQDADIILHHYAPSPFSEKIRLTLGYCEARWYSVISPAMPPRPVVDPIVGGYRRIPVMQIGADVFCDTKLISAELAARFSKPELNPFPESALLETNKDAIDYSHNVDTNIFMAGVQSSKPLAMLVAVFKLFSPLDGLKFIKDRASIQKRSSLKPIGYRRANDLLDQHYHQMEVMLKSSSYLFSDDKPSVADFSAYHNLWFKHLTQGSSTLESKPSVNAWFQRMAKFGHGEEIEGSKSIAFSAAKETQTREITDANLRHDHIGKKVSIAPNDYAKDAVDGVLLGTDDYRWIIARETNDFGRINVHFPKQGFELNLVS